MTQAVALTEAKRLQAAMGRWEVPCSIELQAGRGSDPWGVYKKYHRMWHHTVSTYRVGGSLTPVLWLVKVGRPDVIGPLCNGYIGYDRVFRIICMGEANHPGLGGPITIDGVRIPLNSARRPTFGIEVEGGLQTWEEIDRLGPDMLQVMGRADCALAEWSNRPLTSQMEHKTWAPTRKVDRKDFDAARVRGIALTRKWHAIEEDDMPLTDTDLAKIGAIVDAKIEAKAQDFKNWARLGANEAARQPDVGKGRTLGSRLDDIDSAIAAD
jgi:hypothetical protein